LDIEGQEVIWLALIVGSMLALASDSVFLQVLQCIAALPMLWMLRESVR
jgi:hypothetical protein